MLSSQTKDAVTYQAVRNLQDRLKGGLTLESVLDASEEEIQACIGSVGFWRRKAEYVTRSYHRHGDALPNPKRADI
jgi:endonuclease-3